MLLLQRFQLLQLALFLSNFLPAYLLGPKKPHKWPPRKPPANLPRQVQTPRHQLISSRNHEEPLGSGYEKNMIAQAHLSLNKLNETIATQERLKSLLGRARVAQRRQLPPVNLLRLLIRVVRLLLRILVLPLRVLLFPLIVILRLLRGVLRLLDPRLLILLLAMGLFNILRIAAELILNILRIVVSVRVLRHKKHNHQVEHLIHEQKPQHHRQQKQHKPRANHKSLNYCHSSRKLSLLTGRPGQDEEEEEQLAELAQWQREVICHGLPHFGPKWAQSYHDNLAEDLYEGGHSRDDVAQGLSLDQQVSQLEKHFFLPAHNPHLSPLSNEAFLSNLAGLSGH